MLAEVNPAGCPSPLLPEGNFPQPTSESQTPASPFPASLAATPCDDVPARRTEGMSAGAFWKRSSLLMTEGYTRKKFYVLFSQATIDAVMRTGAAVNQREMVPTRQGEQEGGG